MASNEEVIEMLKTAYSMELETVMNYLANSINLDGVRAEEIKKSLAADITEELGHATQLGHRIKQLGGMVPGSMVGEAGQSSAADGEHDRRDRRDQGRDRRRRSRLCAVQEDHPRHRRRGLRDAGFVHHVALGAEEEHLVSLQGLS